MCNVLSYAEYCFDLYISFFVLPMSPIGLLYRVSQNEVIKILAQYCSKSKKNLTIPVFLTKM